VNTTQGIAENLARDPAAHHHVSDGLWRQYVDSYLTHLVEDSEVTVEPGPVARQIAAHLDMGRVRCADEDLVRAITPASGAEKVASILGSTVVQIVTTDRPLLVDTLTMEVHRQGWTLRRLVHPQLGVVRDASGDHWD
jgi:glutamate dehydrogenase